MFLHLYLCFAIWALKNLTLCVSYIVIYLCSKNQPDALPYANTSRCPVHIMSNEYKTPQLFLTIPVYCMIPPPPPKVLKNNCMFYSIYLLCGNKYVMYNISWFANNNVCSSLCVLLWGTLSAECTYRYASHFTKEICPIIF